MSANKLFSAGGSVIRVVDTSSGNLFPIAEILKSIGVTSDSAKRLLPKLDQDEKELIEIDTEGGRQRALAVTESGLYHLMFLAKTDKARKFRRWVTSEVLPQLRKTGAYEITDKAYFDVIEAENHELKYKLSLLIDDDELRTITNGIFYVMGSSGRSFSYSELKEAAETKTKREFSDKSFFEGMRLMHKRNEITQKNGKWETRK